LVSFDRLPLAGAGAAKLFPNPGRILFAENPSVSSPAARPNIPRFDDVLNTVQWLTVPPGERPDRPEKDRSA
jgi:hypothetical protein